jgi:predicted heme/steroid binding protein
MHSAGKNLTGEISNAPHGKEVLSKFPVVGELRE